MRKPVVIENLDEKLAAAKIKSFRCLGFGGKSHSAQWFS